MKRRDFLKSVSGLAAGAMVPAPAIFSPAKADARSETLLIVSEGGPNNLDIHGVGTNVPGYEVSWNCYDRLISHEMKSGPGGVPYYDRDKFKPRTRRRHEDRRHVGDLQAEEEREIPRRHAGHGQGRQMVARSRGLGRRLSDLPDERGLADQARAVRRRRRQHRARRFCQEGPPDDSRSRGHRALHRQFGTGEEERLRKRSLGSRIHQAADRGLRRLQGDEVDRRHRSDHGAQRRVGRRSVAEDQARDLAHGAAGRQPPRAAGARRRRHLL